MECFKSCCEKLMRKKVKEHETQVIKMKMPPVSPSVGEGRKGAMDDYLMSKLPPDGKVVPFVLPTLKPSYIQPKGPRYPNLNSGLQSSARYTYAERKAELLGSSHISYGDESKFHRDQATDYNSPGSTRRRHVHKNYSPQSTGWSLEGGHQKLSSSMFDLSNSHSHIQHLDSVSSTVSSTSSVVGSLGSSLDSIPLAGDERERELGKVCVRLNYEQAVEQVWITLVQCSDLSVPGDCVEQQKIRCKGIITMPKPIQFKTSIKDYSQDVAFMETFVFALRLQQLRCSSLLLRLQIHAPRKRTVAECVLSLRELGTQEAEHWLNLCPPSKSSVCHSELHLSICFQPVNGRIQLQVLAAQNLPAFSSPLTHTFFVKVEMYQSGLVVMKKNTHALKSLEGQCQWAETFHFPLPALDHDPSLTVKLYSRSSVRRKQYLGQVQLGLDSTVPEVVSQWKDMMAHPEKVVTAWHRLGTS